MSWHLTATRTVTPSLKSARDYCGSPQPPRILKTGTIQDVYHWATDHFGAGAHLYNEMMACARGCPLFQTSDWTYYIVGDETEEQRVR